ncbi:MAG: hypothetical protein JWN15_149, partial [Firmicutes bacterium]|nr:hypothetical protein [Bacillota bacterium]
EGHNTVAEAVWQYGATSPEAAAAVKQLGESQHPKELVALLDPTTGKAISAWPADKVGQTPDQMALSGGVKLPTVDKLLYRPHARLGAGNEAARLSVQATPLYPWSGGGFEGQGRGGREQGRGDQGGGDRGRFGQGGEWGQGRGDNRQNVGTPAAPVKPEAILLVATPPETVSVLGVLAGIAGALAALSFVVYWLSVAWWVFADARRRGGKAFAWGVLALLTNLVGAAVYLVARREQRHCSTCGAVAERGFNHCPHCGSKLKRLCPQCGDQLKDGWTHCANCGTPAEPGA